jgi:dihydroorotate dehydrogenase (fumarate)
MIDLTTTYLGLELRSPIVASASPLTRDVDAARAMEAAGAGAIVLPSLFEEEIVNEELELNRAIEQGTEHFPEALDYFPELPAFDSVLDRYLATIADMKRELTIPVIASLNATSSGEWIRYAQLLADAGADAIELNVYRLAADPTQSAADIEAGDVELVADVSGAVARPVAVKLAPYYTAMANLAQRVATAGAHGLVLFNRFYQPDLDLEALDVVPRIDLSAPWELRLPLRWIAILRPVLGPDVSLAATSGVHSGTDVLKALMVGADVAMMTSALLHDGPGHIATVVDELQSWMAAHEYVGVAQLRGSMSYAASDRPGAFERANYIRSLHSLATPADLVPAAPLGSSGLVQPPNPDGR